MTKQKKAPGKGPEQDLTQQKKNVQQNITIPIQEFLSRIFAYADESEQVYTGNLFSYIPPSKLSRTRNSPHYFLTSTVTPSDTPTRRGADFERMHCVVLDDVGSKCEAGTIQPSWIIESSAGNFQHGFILETPLEVSEGAQLLSRIAALEVPLSDPGALSSPGRLVRLPSGINGKKLDDGTRNEFQVRLVAWNPELTYDVPALADGWSLAPFEESMSGCRTSTWDWTKAPMSVEAQGSWDVLRHFDVIGQADGKVFVTCPNEAAHTSPDKLKDSCILVDEDGHWGYSCLHGHCTSDQFDINAWFQERAFAGLPSAPEGTAPPVLNSRIRGVLSSEADSVQAMIDRTIYLTTGSGEFFDTVRKERIKSSAFDGEYKNYFPKIKKEPRTSASEHYCELDNKRIARGVAWSPEPDDIIDFDGKQMANTYVAPTMVPAEGDVTEWLELLRHVYGEHWELVLQHMAFTIQRPLVKIRWQILTHGAPRTGKSLSMNPLKKILGPSCGTVDHVVTKSGWGDMYLRKKALIIEEVHAPNDHAFFNSMKAHFANDDIEALNVKTKGMEYQRNLYSMYMFSNYENAVTMQEDDDKLLVIQAPDQRWSDARYHRLGDAIENNTGFQAACYHHLLHVDLSSFNPNQLPVRTEALLAMVESNRPQYEHWIMREAHKNLPMAPLSDKMFSTTEVIDTLKREGYPRVSNQGVSNALVRAGYVKCIGQKFGGRPQKYRYWARPGLIAGMDAREIYDLYAPTARGDLPTAKGVHLKPIKK